MEIEYIEPSKIEQRSFEIISKELDDMGIVLDRENEPVIKRAIHTSADFDYAKTLIFSKDATKKAIELLKCGTSIITDTNMALTGINKKILESIGGKAYCFMADEDIMREAKARGVTRATVSMEHAFKLEGPKMFVIGNAPTALIALKEQIDRGNGCPDFIIGVPVGFVNVEASKELFIGGSIPYIINRGRKGGSNIAAAIVNALLYQIKR